MHLMGDLLRLYFLQDAVLDELFRIIDLQCKENRNCAPLRTQASLSASMQTK